MPHAKHPDVYKKPKNKKQEDDVIDISEDVSQGDVERLERLAKVAESTLRLEEATRKRMSLTQPQKPDLPDRGFVASIRRSRERNSKPAGAQPAPAGSPTKPQKEAKPKQESMVKTPVAESPWPMLIIGGGLFLTALVYFGRSYVIPIINKLLGME